jgi:Protein of unknown function (DUF4031)
MVYVDNSRNSYGRMTMCHMVADNLSELLEMAMRIGVQKRWLQYPGTYKEHFDICKSKRVLAIHLGAVEVTSLELGRMLLEKRKRHLSSRG